MRRDGLGVGLFFLAAGVLFLLDALDAIDLRPEFLLPLLLIGFGLALLVTAGQPRPVEERAEEERPEEERPEEEAQEAEEERTEEEPPPDEG